MIHSLGKAVAVQTEFAGQAGDGQLRFYEPLSRSETELPLPGLGLGVSRYRHVELLEQAIDARLYKAAQAPKAMTVRDEGYFLVPFNKRYEVH